MNDGITSKRYGLKYGICTYIQRKWKGQYMYIDEVIECRSHQISIDAI
jgi:hypothetical protein